MRCTICNSNKIEHLKIGQKHVIQQSFGAPILECLDCKFVYADFIHPQVIHLFYRNFCRPNHSTEEFTHLRKIAKESALSQIELILPYFPKKIDRVLDYGGGSGEAARLFLPHADKVFITEMDPNSLKHIKEEPKLNVVDEAQLMDDEYIGFFDLIIFSNVLEHVSNPISMIQQFSRLLANGGYLFIEVPNEAPWIRSNGNHCRQHLGFYTIETLKTLIKNQMSFDIRGLKTCGPKVTDIIAKNQLIHDFSAKTTKNGWIIRAMIQNNRPQRDLKADSMSFNEGAEIAAKMSINLFLKENRKFLNMR